MRNPLSVSLVVLTTIGAWACTGGIEGAADNATGNEEPGAVGSPTKTPGTTGPGTAGYGMPRPGGANT